MLTLVRKILLLSRSMLQTIRNYIEVLKVRETLLLGFLGLCSVIIASHPHPESFLLPGSSFLWLHWNPYEHYFAESGTILLATVTILIASGGANGLTNYLDRGVDARMQRTKNRVFPSQRIYPAEKGLVWILFLIVVGLVLSWVLHPYVFLANLIGTIAAAVFRKRVICVFPQGVIASCAPVLMGWFAVRSDVSMELILLCLLIIVWLPLHVWSVMVSHRDDYIGAGLTFFPMSVSVRTAVGILLIFACLLNVVSIALFFVAGYSLLYLIVALVLGVAMLGTTVRLFISHTSRNAWKLYKLSSFPYMGLIFLVICLSLWLDICHLGA